MLVKSTSQQRRLRTQGKGKLFFLLYEEMLSLGLHWDYVAGNNNINNNSNGYQLLSNTFMSVSNRKKIERRRRKRLTGKRCLFITSVYVWIKNLIKNSLSILPPAVNFKTSFNIGFLGFVLIYLNFRSFHFPTLFEYPKIYAPCSFYDGDTLQSGCKPCYYDGCTCSRGVSWSQGFWELVFSPLRTFQSAAEANDLPMWKKGRG